MLAAVVGALARAGLDDCPGVVMDAPCPGSGKTICASAVGAVVLGRRAPVTPFAGVDDAELKKQMVANCLDGFNWLLLDNVVGLYDSAVMASVLTTGALRDRVLGSSLMFDGEVKLNIFLTSNNASLSRDLHRRFVRVRIDTGVRGTSRRPLSTVSTRLIVRWLNGWSLLALFVFWCKASLPLGHRVSAKAIAAFLHGPDLFEIACSGANARV